MIRALVTAPSVSCSFSRFPVARTGQRYTFLGALDENGKFLAAKRFTLYTMRMYTPALIRPYIYTLCHLPVIENCLT